MEAVIALAILTLVGAALYAAISSSWRAHGRAALLRCMTEIAEDWRGRVLLADDPTELEGEGTTNLLGHAVAWQVETDPTDVPDVVRVRLELRPVDGSLPPRVFETLRTLGR